MKPSELRAEQKELRARNTLATRQRAMRARWAKRRQRDEDYRLAQMGFLREFAELCYKYSLNLDIRQRMEQEFMKRIVSRDELKIRTLQGGGWPLF